jgi:hypothetical protein
VPVPGCLEPLAKPPVATGYSSPASVRNRTPSSRPQRPLAQRPVGQRQAVALSGIVAPVSEPDWVGRADWSTLRKTSQLVRPYSWTGGRTTSPVNLKVETLV